MNDLFTLASSGCISSGTSYHPLSIPSSGTASSFSTVSSGTISINTNMNKPVQNKVAVFKVTRNDKNEITSTEFLKEMWVETKNNQAVDFVVARDKDLVIYNAEDLSIRVIYSVTF